MLKYFFAFLMALQVCNSPIQATSDFMVENFDSPLSGFTPFSSGIPTLGNSTVHDGLLEITHQPASHYNNYGLKKTYTYDVSRTTWFIFKFRYTDYRLGSDMYTSISFPDKNNPNNQLHFTIGINSEQHWKSVYYFPGNEPPCTPKTRDDEFFISVSNEIISNAPDARLVYPTGLTNNYTDWTEFAIKYDPISETLGLFSLYINGVKVDSVHPLDNPTQTLDFHSNALAGRTEIPITLSFEVLVDGWEYAYPGNKYGTRGRGCYAQKSPAIPSAIRYPLKFNDTEGLNFKTVWMVNYDNVAKTTMAVLSTSAPAGYGYRPYSIPHSALSPLPKDFIYPTRPEEYIKAFTNLQSQIESNLYQLVQKNLWDGIYGGTVDLDTAILMGAINIPDTSHPIWNYNPSGSRERLIAKLADLQTYYGALPPPKRFVLDQMFSVGGVPDTVHLGYLTPEDIVAIPQLTQYLSQSEKDSIPLASYPSNTTLQWDYFKIVRDPLAPPPDPLDLDVDGDVDFIDLFINLQTSPNTIFFFNNYLNMLY